VQETFPRRQLNAVTLHTTKDAETSFVVSQRPTKPLDANCLSGAREESEECLDNVSELSTVPLLTQTHDRWQHQATEVQSYAVVSLGH